MKTNEDSKRIAKILLKRLPNNISRYEHADQMETVAQLLDRKEDIDEIISIKVQSFRLFERLRPILDKLKGELYATLAE